MFRRRGVGGCAGWRGTELRVAGNLQRGGDGVNDPSTEVACRAVLIRNPEKDDRLRNVPLTSNMERVGWFSRRASGDAGVLFPCAAEICWRSASVPKIRVFVDSVETRGSTPGEVTTRGARVPARRRLRGAQPVPGDAGNGGRTEARQGAIRIFLRVCLRSGLPENRELIS